MPTARPTRGGPGRRVSERSALRGLHGLARTAHPGLGLGGLDGGLGGCRGLAGTRPGLGLGLLGGLRRNLGDGLLARTTRLGLRGSGGVELTSANVAKSLDAAKFLKDGSNDLALDLNGIYASNTPGAYPLLLTTYEIVCSKYANPDVAKAVKAFLTVAATDGQAPLSAKGYVPIPQSLQTKVLTAVKAIS